MPVGLICVASVVKDTKKSSKLFFFKCVIAAEISDTYTKIGFNLRKWVSCNGTDTETDKQTNRTTDITDRRLNQPMGQFSENQTEKDIS